MSSTSAAWRVMVIAIGLAFLFCKAPDIRSFDALRLDGLNLDIRQH